MLENKIPSLATKRRWTSRPHRSPRRSSKAAGELKRSSSEPTLFIGGKDCPSWRSYSNLQPRTCSSSSLSSSSLFTGYPHSFEDGKHEHFGMMQGYNRDAKVVITVTVEGSPGPIRAMVKLGFSVEEMIKCVLDRYSIEGRTPKLENNSSYYELHRSYFSIQCLDKSQLIGDIGCRTFYLRKCNSSSHSISGDSASCTSLKASNPPSLLPPPLFLVSPLFARRFKKLERRVRKLWRFLVCLQ